MENQPLTRQAVGCFAVPSGAWMSQNQSVLMC